MTQPITQTQLDALERAADKVFAKLGIDIEFTRHFLDRVNDERNRKQITIRELGQIFAKEYKKWGKTIANMPVDAQAVMKDLSTEINIPFVLNPDKDGKKLITKTVMRKKDFKTPDKKLPVESIEVDEETINEVRGGKVIGSKNGYPVHDMGEDYPWPEKRYHLRDPDLDVWQDSAPDIKSIIKIAMSLEPASSRGYGNQTQGQIDHDDWRDEQKSNIATGRVRSAVKSRRGVDEDLSQLPDWETIVAIAVAAKMTPLAVKALWKTAKGAYKIKKFADRVGINISSAINEISDEKKAEWLKKARKSQWKYNDAAEAGKYFADKGDDDADYWEDYADRMDKKFAQRNALIKKRRGDIEDVDALGWPKRTNEEMDEPPLTVKTYSPDEIAQKHGVPIDQILQELDMGINVELEHTDDEERAREIALDHLLEMPDYYTRLLDMEGHDTHDAVRAAYESFKVDEKIIPPKEAFMMKLLQYLDKKIKTEQGSKMTVAGNAFDVLRSFNVPGLSARKLESIYNEWKASGELPK